MNTQVQVEVLSGRALVDGVEIVLTGPQRLLVCALAKCRHPVDREHLEAMFWPDDEPERARNLLNIAVCRLASAWATAPSCSPRTATASATS